MIANTGNAERIAAAVAAELGTGWAVSAGYRGDGSDARLTADGVSVHLMTDSWGHRDRYVFSGDLPRDARDFLPYRATVPEITTAPTKTPAQIAAEQSALDDAIERLEAELAWTERGGDDPEAGWTEAERDRKSVV